MEVDLKATIVIGSFCFWSWEAPKYLTVHFCFQIKEISPFSILLLNRYSVFCFSVVKAVLSSDYARSFWERPALLLANIIQIQYCAVWLIEKIREYMDHIVMSASLSLSVGISIGLLCKQPPSHCGERRW